MRVHKVVVDSWPTPDGKPFIEQPEEVWESFAEHYLGNEGERPEWLPKDLDITEWLPWQDGDGRWEYPPKPGDWVGGNMPDELIMTVPRVPLRRHYFSKAAALRVVASLTEWGVIARVESSEPLVWASADG